MNRREALKHFEDEYVQPSITEMKKNIERYTDEHRKELTEEFIENFRILCDKIKVMQDEGRKDCIYNLFLQRTQFAEGKQGVCSTGIRNRMVFGKGRRMQNNI